jgi:signal peptidase I
MTFKSWRRIATWTIRLLLLAVLGLVAFAIAVLTVIPRATHGTALTVLTGSMTPGIPVGSVVVDRPVDPGTLHVGDVATYQVAPGKAEYITHRIIRVDASKTPTMFIFKGDANRGPDIDPVPATAIRGKVWFHVPYLGSLRDAMHTKGGLAGVAMVVLAAYAFYMAVTGLKDRGKDGKADAPVDVSETQPRFAVLMTVANDAFDGLAPDAVARALGATLVDTNASHFTLRVTEAACARDALELIDAVAI